MDRAGEDRGWRRDNALVRLPELTLTHPFPGQSIWVEVEVRFDVQVEGSSVLWIGRDVVAAGRQWHAVPEIAVIDGDKPIDPGDIRPLPLPRI